MPADIAERVREVAARMGPGASHGANAIELNARGIRTARHGRWHARTVAVALAAEVPCAAE